MQLNHTSSDSLGHTAWALVPSWWWSLRRRSVWHKRLVCSCERNLLRSSPLQLAPRSRSPSGTWGVLLNLPEHRTQKRRAGQFSAVGGFKVLATKYRKLHEQLSVSVLLFVYATVLLWLCTNSWFNSTWQESLPPSWYPAQIMSYRMSTWSFGSSEYISWHELWEMIGTITSCRVPTPCRGTVHDTTDAEMLVVICIHIYCILQFPSFFAFYAILQSCSSIFLLYFLHICAKCYKSPVPKLLYLK